MAHLKPVNLFRIQRPVGVGRLPVGHGHSNVHISELCMGIFLGHKPKLCCGSCYQFSNPHSWRAISQHCFIYYCRGGLSSRQLTLVWYPARNISSKCIWPWQIFLSLLIPFSQSTLVWVLCILIVLYEYPCRYKGIWDHTSQVQEQVLLQAKCELCLIKIIFTTLGELMLLYRKEINY